MPDLPFFVYGTLIPGQPNDHHWLGRITATEPAVIERARLHDLGAFPMLVEVDHETGERVSGRLVSVQPDGYPAVMAALDELEDYHPDDEANSIYLRVVRDVLTRDGQRVPAWVYIGRPSIARAYPLIPEGDWPAYCRREKGGSEMAAWWRTNGLDFLFGKNPESDP